MKCPICVEANLIMSERQGIEVDYCPQCRGVWLDRGELDKIIERASTMPAQWVTETPQPQTLPPMQTQMPLQHEARSRPPRRDYDDDDDERGGYRDDYRRRKKRGGFLEELFDFD